MAERDSRVIRGDQDIDRARMAFHRFWRWCLDRGLHMRMTLEQYVPPRTLDQSALFHCMVRDVARQCEWDGRRWNEQAWKVLMISAHAIASDEPGEVLRGLEGEFVAIRESTARMSKARTCSLIDYVDAWGSQNGVKWSQPGDLQTFREQQARAA